MRATNGSSAREAERKAERPRVGAESLRAAGEVPAPPGEDAVVLRNGESTTVGDIRVKAVPAYNIRQKRPNGQPYHPKGAGNGYLVSFGDFVVHIGADTECVPEMRDLGRVDDPPRLGQGALLDPAGDQPVDLEGAGLAQDGVHVVGVLGQLGAADGAVHAGHDVGRGARHGDPLAVGRLVGVAGGAGVEPVPHPAGGDAEEDLRFADFHQHGALLRSERHAGEDLQGVARAAAVHAHAPRQPGERKDRSKNGEQGERDRQQTTGADRGRGAAGARGGEQVTHLSLRSRSAGLMTSVRRIPKRSFTTTTSPWATSVPVT